MAFKVQDGGPAGSNSDPKPPSKTLYDCDCAGASFWQGMKAVEGALKEPRAAALASEMQTKLRSRRASKCLSTMAFQSTSNWPIALGFRLACEFAMERRQVSLLTHAQAGTPKWICGEILVRAGVTGCCQGFPLAPFHSTRGSQYTPAPRGGSYLRE